MLSLRVQRTSKYDEDNQDDELEESKDEIIEGLQKEYDKEGDESKDMELKIDKMKKSPNMKLPNEDFSFIHDLEENDNNAKLVNLIKKNSSIGKSNLINLSLKNSQRKDGTLRRCRICASCKFKCGECKSCLGNKSAKQGCRRRFTCLRNSCLIDDPNLHGSCQKRGREDEEEIAEVLCKELKLSVSPESGETRSMASSSSLTGEKGCLGNSKQ